MLSNDTFCQTCETVKFFTEIWQKNKMNLHIAPLTEAWPNDRCSVETQAPMKNN